jgi:hypothetical protein
LKPPALVLDATKDYRDEMDVMGNGSMITAGVARATVTE